jgi:subtilisin family serine protease
VINLSFGNSTANCTADPPFCDAIAYADQKDVLLVAAAGNYNQTVPQFPANQTSTFSIGGVQNMNASFPGSWALWFYDSANGSNYAGISGVVAPAKSIVSTVPAGMFYNGAPYANCADTLPTDESGIANDGYGSCTGTSMSAPHVSALAGIVRSVNPRLFRDTIKSLIRSSGSHYASQTGQLGAGLPNARLAVDLAIAQTPNRLTPLFSMYSGERLDYFYTTVPQMGAAASWGSLQPVNTPSESSRYVPAGGAGINNYSSFPGGYPFTSPLAEVWLFTTPENPKSTSVSLVPLYRLSWKCGDYTPSPPVVCSSNPQHVDTTYTADPNGEAIYRSWGYRLDGIEGYLYPKTVTQPTGTVWLMRKYNPARDDHAIFPETALSAMTAQGYTENSGSDWLGYVYPNTTANVPVIY